MNTSPIEILWILPHFRKFMPRLCSIFFMTEDDEKWREDPPALPDCFHLLSSLWIHVWSFGLSPCTSSTQKAKACRSPKLKTTLRRYERIWLLVIFGSSVTEPSSRSSVSDIPVSHILIWPTSESESPNSSSKSSYVVGSWNRRASFLSSQLVRLLEWFPIATPRRRAPNWASRKRNALTTALTLLRRGTTAKKHLIWSMILAISCNVSGHPPKFNRRHCKKRSRING